MSGKGKSHRSAASGRFVTKGAASRHPATTVTESRGGGSTHGSHRSAVTGKFVEEGYAKRHPTTTLKDS
jgi:hypothetical protein